MVKAPTVRRLLVLALAMFTATALVSCSDKPTNPDSDNHDTNADSLVQLANAQLESILYAQLNSATPPQRPSDINFGAPENLYRRALAVDPTNATAGFGVATLGLMSLSYDSEVNAAFDEWKTYLETHVPFDAGSSAARPLGVPILLGSGLAGLALPYEIVPLSLVANARALRTTVEPRLSRAQAILRQRALPRLEQSIGYLGTALAAPGFQFTITSNMQGGGGAQYRLVRHTDLLALRAAAQLLQSACNIAVSYQLDFASYDSAGLAAAFRPNSGWLALAPDGATRMGSARTQALGAITDGQSAIAELRAQTGNHDHDLIKVPPGPGGIAKLDSLRDHLQLAQQGLTGGLTLTEDWDGNPATPPTTMTLRPDQLFTQPIADWKALFPGYTVRAVKTPLPGSWRWENGSTSRNVNIGSADWHYGNCSMNRSGPLDTPHTYISGTTAIHSAVLAEANAQLARISALPGFTNHYWLSTSFAYTYLSAGNNSISIAWSTDYELSQGNVYVPEITWDANSASQWTWPDPTLGGVLPNMSSSSQLLTTFGFDPADWTKTITLTFQ